MGMEESMAEGVLMPKAGITVEECIITEWMKKKGDKVAVGEVLFTYETDKATFECESTAKGEMLEVFYLEGDEVPVLEVVCAIGQPGESTDNLKGGAEAAPEGHQPATGKTANESVVNTTANETEIPTIHQVTEQTASTVNTDMKISPRARMTASAMGVNPALANPTGPDGRIVEKDVRDYAVNRPLKDVAEPVEANPEIMPNIPSVENEYEDIKFSGVRKATAKAMTKSLTLMAQLTHQHSFDATTIQALRKNLKQRKEVLNMSNITLNDMVLFAVSRVLLNHQDLNANMLEENSVRRFKHVHLGMAVDTPKGLFVPVIRYADQMSLEEISIEAKRIAKICQEGKATPDMMSGGTFTVSNLGSLGVEMFTPVINPPQTGILGVCGINTRVREVNGELKGYPSMGLSLTYDHRAVDGSPASRFMKELCTALENLNLMLMK